MTIQRLWGEVCRWVVRTLKFQLLPLHDINGTDSLWIASSTDPAWQLELTQGRMPRGWYMLSVRLNSNLAKSVAKLYVDYGSGFSENNSMPLLVKSDKLVKRICYFPQIPTRIRFDPSEQAAVFTVQELSLARLSKHHAYKLINKKLGRDRAISNDESIIKCWNLYNQKFRRQILSLSNSSSRNVKISQLGPSSVKLNPNAQIISNTQLSCLNRLFPCELTPETQVYNPKSLSIHWVIPDFSAGSGGHMTIFRIAWYLEFLGHEITFWVYNPKRQSEDTTYDFIVNNFQPLKAKVNFIEDRVTDSGDIIFATDWGSVSYVVSAEKFKRRFYFVQDYEPDFYPKGSLSLAAEQTYYYELDCICAGPWLKDLMSTRFNRWAGCFSLGVDHDIYHSRGRVTSLQSVTRIAFYARHFTSRRVVELGWLLLEALAKQGVAFEVHCFGASQNIGEAPFACIDHGVISSAQLAELYRTCDLGLVFSATNYSLIPQEMMACGLPVLELDSPCNRQIYPVSAITLVEPTISKMLPALRELVESDSKRNSQAEHALKWVRQFTWEKAALTVENLLISRLDELGYNETTAHNQSAEEFMASIVIPTFNGGEILHRVIDAVERQVTPWAYEILVIDSSSSDGTLEYLQSRQKIKLHVIDQSEFQHGKTRNLGVSLTTGKYIAFLTQDALPKSKYWLYILVSALERYPDAAGVFGKHEAWPSADPFTVRDIDDHFRRFEKYPLCVSRHTDSTKWKKRDQHWQQFLHFYSDNNSCMRRSVWKKIPYPNIDYGEDQAWAWEVICKGYSKVYSKHAVVYHSHDYINSEVEERSYIEANFFKDVFGYSMLTNTNGQDAIKSMNLRDSEWGQSREIAESVINRRLQQNSARVKGYKKALADH